MEDKCNMASKMCTNYHDEDRLQKCTICNQVTRFNAKRERRSWLLMYKRFPHLHFKRPSLPFVELAIDNILRLIRRSSGREVQKMRQEFLWHIV